MRSATILAPCSSVEATTVNTSPWAPLPGEGRTMSLSGSTQARISCKHVCLVASQLPTCGLQQGVSWTATRDNDSSNWPASVLTAKRIVGNENKDKLKAQTDPCQSSLS